MGCRGGAPYAGPVEPSWIPAVAVGAVVVAFGVAVLVALALDRPDPAETAVAYEEAWDRLDFAGLWDLSGPELRDGRSRREFVAEKGARYRERADLAGLVARVEVLDLRSVGRRARVVTRLELHDGSEVRDEMRLRRDGNRWFVSSYRTRIPAG